MFNENRKEQFDKFAAARKYFIKNFHELIKLEEFFASYLSKKISDNLDDIVLDYNEASYLYPFWQNYPPDDRGRKPRGDQFPWIEVGEHVIGRKLSRFLAVDFETLDSGLPAGADERFILKSNDVKKITKGYTNTCWLFIDIKSVGPRDDQEHTVMSHNQISGDGIWKKEGDGVKNSTLEAKGKLTTHPFHCSIPPIYILSDGSIAPVIIVVVKLVYKMLSLETPPESGQPLGRITIVSIPNGLLLIKKPNYLKKYPSLLFPGKDDKGKNPLKVRCRISFSILEKIAKWRLNNINI